jgi:hypothetical protein
MGAIMTPEFDLMISCARGQMYGTITRCASGGEVELRDDQCVQLIEALAGSDSRVDTLRHFFLLNNGSRPALQIVSTPQPERTPGDWRL